MGRDGLSSPGGSNIALGGSRRDLSGGRILSYGIRAQRALRLRSEPSPGTFATMGVHVPPTNRVGNRELLQRRETGASYFWDETVDVT